MARRSEYAKERKEHPWASPTQIRRVVKDHNTRPTGKVVGVVVVPLAKKKRKPVAPRSDWWNMLY